jgi:hypothetical protein
MALALETIGKSGMKINEADIERLSPLSLTILYCLEDISLWLAYQILFLNL